MFSQNVAKITPPSHFYFRTQLPLQQQLNQWKAVYYFSGVSNRIRRNLALQEKAALVEATRVFEGKKAFALKADTQFQQAVLYGSSSKSSTAAAAAAGDYKVSDVIGHVELLNSFAFTDLSHPYVQTLHAKRQLPTPADYAAVIRSYRAEGVRQHLLYTNAKYDTAQSYKQMGEHRAAERAGEAARVLEMAIERFYSGSGADGGESSLSLASSSSSLSSVSAAAAAATSLTQCFNAYMEVMLTCGYDGMRSVPNFIYEKMGELGVAPSLATYESVVIALGLTGEITEAEQVANFVISKGFPIATAAVVSESDPSASSSSSSVTGALAASSSSLAVTAQKLLPIYNALLMGYRDNKMFDKCDLLWRELVQSRCPRPNATTADLYLRAIIDLSYTRTSDMHSKFAELNAVEKKRIPLVLAQLDELGIPRTHLSVPVHHEVEDALRKFSIRKERFYNWGRAVKQFNFVEFRRRNGWLYGLDEMIPTTDRARLPRRLPWSSGNTTESGAIGSAGQVEVPAGIFDENRPWLDPPMNGVLNRVERKERMDDTRAAEYFYDDATNIHNRPPTWSSEVPQTRYDHLYGISKPDLHRTGIRRHMASEWADGVLGGEERKARDEAVLKNIVQTARRARQRPEVFSTHRTSPFDN